MATISRYLGYVNGIQAAQDSIVLPAIETRSVIERLHEMKQRVKNTNGDQKNNTAEEDN